jgi:putative ABC transport system ATP-binding protein
LPRPHPADEVALLPTPPGRGPARVRLESVVKRYGEAEAAFYALDRVTLEIPAGEFTAIVGRSGSGKSTLLNLLAGLDTPTSGEIWVGDREISRLSDDALTVLRRDELGIIYQFFNLLPTLSVRENVALPSILAGRGETEALARAEALLEEVGLGNRRNARPHTLSGGEMQRAAIARALIHHPGLVLADEPTGNLDTRNADQILGLLTDLARKQEATVVLVTHSREAAGIADRIIELRDGRVVSDTTG